MLEILGRPTKLCQPISRRAMLGIGGLAPLGLSLPGLLASQACAASPAAIPPGNSFGSAKRCLLIFMWGGPAHQDLWDMKPQASAEVRGEFKTVEARLNNIDHRLVQVETRVIKIDEALFKPVLSRTGD